MVDGTGTTNYTYAYNTNAWILDHVADAATYDAAGTKVSDLAGFFRTVWSLGKAGVQVPLTIYRDGRTIEARVTSVLKQHPCSAGICQYDLHLFNGATLMDVLTVHPYTIVRGQFVENPFFVEAEQFLKSRAGKRVSGHESAQS